MSILATIHHRDQIGPWLNEHGLTGHAAEIGVMHGGFSKLVLEHWRGERYYMVDPWARQEAVIYRERTDDVDYEAKYQDCVAIAAQYPIVKMLRMLSVDAALEVPDASLDFCFIDANHSYQAVLSDMDAWWPKMKRGGLFSGHDFGNDTRFPNWCEVQAAVERWMREHEIRFVTTPCSSWWSLKP